MKTKIAITFVFSVVSFMIIFSSCKHGCDGEGGTSGLGESNSHNTGKNCMECHSGTGKGQGCFTVAGTIYDSLQQSTYKKHATIALYTAANGGGQLQATLTADALGNFYTGKSIDFSKGLFPAVTGVSGTTNFMSAAVRIGECNNCHGVSTGRIWAE